MMGIVNQYEATHYPVSSMMDIYMMGVYATKPNNIGKWDRNMPLFLWQWLTYLLCSIQHSGMVYETLLMLLQASGYSVQVGHCHLATNRLLFH